MLVFNRKQGEQVVIPDSNVTITVLHLAGGRVRLGISAPRQVAVHRQEVWNEINAESEMAATQRG
jgi:carbon storage regulator